MFSALQFSQLAAAAWPATLFEATITTTSLGATRYQLTFQPGRHEFLGLGSTPFEAVAAAIEDAWCSNAFAGAAYRAALATIEQAEQAALARA